MFKEGATILWKLFKTIILFLFNLSDRFDDYYIFNFADYYGFENGKMNFLRKVIRGDNQIKHEIDLFSGDENRKIEIVYFNENFHLKGLLDFITKIWRLRMAYLF